MDPSNFDIIDLDDFPDNWDSNPKNANCQIEEKDVDAEFAGLDMETAGEWIYPTNYPVRDYQKNIVTKALFHNTLVSLPTGLGKTFIAAVVMYNFNRWYPHHKIVFMAHSKPLVAQQLEACCEIMGIPQHVTAQLNGNIASNIRKQHWDSKSIFFLTPQVFNNDLTRGLVSADSIRCVVVDEAHKALGNQAFCQAIKSLQPFNKSFRVLALSATPGDDIPTVKSVIENLLISHLELRTEEDTDIKKYLHVKKVEAVVVSLDSKINEYKSRLLHVTEKYLKQLAQMRAINGSFGSLTSFSLVLKQKQFISNPSVGTEQRGYVLSNFSIAISLYKALEELIVHGLRSFHNKLLGEGSKSNVHHRLAKDPDFSALLEAVENYIGQDKDVAFDPDISMARLQDELDAQVIGGPRPIVYSHPKFVMLEQIITQHFEEWKEKDASTKVIVFCKSRPCTGEICNFLNRFRPLVKPMVLIGQSNSAGGSTTRGLKQSAQLEVMRKFRAGLYNTLVATCVGEEGLDVGEVDLIVNFDSSRNSNTQVQRSGRTGRKRDGRVVNLVTEGKEYQDYNLSLSKSKTITKKLSKGVQNLPLYPNSPRLIPKHIQPVCQEMFLKPAQQSAKKPDKTSDNKKEKKTMDQNSEKHKENPKPADKVSEKKKKKGTKRSKKTDELLASQNYDIRDAMAKVRQKSALPCSEDDESDVMFESQGAVELFKNSAKKQNLNHSQKITSDLITLEDSMDAFPNREEDIKRKSVFSKPLDLEACDFLDGLSFDELIALVSDSADKIEFCASQYTAKFKEFNFNRSSDESSYEYQEIVLSTPPKDENPFIDLSNEWNDDIFTMNVASELKDNSTKNESMLTITQAIAKIPVLKDPEIVKTPETEEPKIIQEIKSKDEETKKVDIQSDYSKPQSCTKICHPVSRSSAKLFKHQDESVSPSLVYSQIKRNKLDSKVKKSLVFTEPSSEKTPIVTNFAVIDLESDDDLFADEEKEREIIMTQKMKEKENEDPQKLNAPIENPQKLELVENPPEVRPPPKLAIVHPMGFESIHGSLFDDSQWLTTDDKPKNTSILSYSGKTEKIKPKKKQSLLSFAAEEKPKKKIEKDPDVTFNCVPDDLFDLFESSPFKTDSPNTPVNVAKGPLKQSTPFVAKFDQNDGELSDGALEAIQAVENFEKGSKPVHKTDRAVFDLWGSDEDDEDFVVQKASPVRKEKIKKPKKKRRRKTNLFIDAEAGLSGGSSSDDEDSSGLDEMDSSFLDERIAPTQAPNVDMTAKYLATTKSPQGMMGRFKIPLPVKCDFQVFSQLDTNDEDYVHDSFCVPDETEDFREELSQIEVVEMMLEKKKKRKRSTAVTPIPGKKKRRRIVVGDSSSDEDESKKSNRKISKTKSSPPCKNFDPSVQPLVFIGSRHIASAPEVTIALRAKFKFRVDVRSCPGADFIVSWRMGINRICLSDFCNGSPIMRTSLRDSAVKLCELFVKPVIIIEDDKNKSVPRTVGCYRDMWVKHSAKRLAKLHFANISTLFSKNKDETAEIIARLTKSECEKGNGVVTDWADFSPALESRIKFYTSLPGVNVAMGLRMCRKFSTLSSFLSTCDSAAEIGRVMGVPESVASKIYIALHST